MRSRHINAVLVSVGCIAISMAVSLALFGCNDGQKTDSKEVNPKNLSDHTTFKVLLEIEVIDKVAPDIDVKDNGDVTIEVNTYEGRSRIVRAIITPEEDQKQKKEIPIDPNLPPEKPPDSDLAPIPMTQ